MPTKIAITIETRTLISKYYAMRNQKNEDRGLPPETPEETLGWLVQYADRRLETLARDKRLRAEKAARPGSWKQYYVRRSDADEPEHTGRTEAELDGMTVKALRALADEKGLEIKSRARKATIVAALLAA